MYQMRSRLEILSRSFVVFLNSLYVSKHAAAGRYPAVSETIPELINGKGKFSLELAAFGKSCGECIVFCHGRVLCSSLEIDYSF
jgi:hypothetical protein